MSSARSRRRPAFAAALVAIALPLASVSANNDLNTSTRFGAITAPTIDGTSAADTDAATAEQGRVGYRVPIVAPPGKSGVEPALALVYGGRSDGVLGTGWTLPVPSIRVKTSGRGGQPAWGVSEIYLGFGGEDLLDAGTVPDVDGDGVDEAAFREERDLSYVRYLRLSLGGWIAEYPDGRKLTLGTTPAARVERAATGWVARWLPETLADPSGNQLVYTWQDAPSVEPTAVSPTERYLTAIRWGCRSCAAATAYQEMTFTYASRAGLTAGPVLDFGPGFLVATELYLTSIATASRGTHPGQVRTYALGYQTDRTRLLLTSVTVTTPDASEPPITFGYTTPSPQAAQPEAVTGVPGVLFKRGVEPMEVDGDGRVDVVDISTVLGAKLYANTGATAASFGAGVAITAPGSLPTTPAVSIVDKDRNLHGDVVDLGSAQAWLHQGASGWGSAVATPPPPPIALGTDTVHADVDLDGYPDLIDTSGTTAWTIYLNDGADGYTEQVTCSPPVGSTDVLTPQVGGVLHARDAGVLFGDVTADGMVDVVYVNAAGDAYVFPGRGRGCWGLWAEDGMGALPYQLLTVTASGGLPVPANLRLADLDGDAFDDLVEVGAPSRVNVWTMVPGAGWVPTSPTGWVQSNSSTSGCKHADFDHDGIVELLCSTGWKLFDFADTLPFLLASVDNGRGAVTSFAYTTSARVAEAHRAAGTPWSTNLGATVPVVATVEQRDGRGHLLTRTFDYRDAYYVTDELEDRYELVGFGYVSERRTPWIEVDGVRGADPADAGVLARRYYDVGATDWFRRGTVTCEETWPGAAVPASFACMAAVGQLAATSWTYATTIDPTWGFVTVQRTAEDRYEAEGTATPVRLRTEWQHDAFGNAIETIEYGRYKVSNQVWGNDEHVLLGDFAVDTTAWNLRLPSRVRHARLTSSGTFVMGRIDYFLYDAAGRLTAARAWVKDPITGAQSTPIVLRRTYTTEGLVASATDAEGTVTAYTYDASLHLLPVREELDPGGLALVQERTIDSRTGAELRRVAPDGTVSEAGYDLLGRMQWLARPGATPAAPTITRSYADGAPLSTVTEVAADGTADGLVAIRSFDGHGRLVCEQREAGGGLYDVRQWDHGARGHVALTVAAYRAAACDTVTLAVGSVAGSRATTRDHDLHVTDARGRPLALAHSDGSARAWEYGALTITEHDEEDLALGSPHAGTPTVTRHDGLGRIISVDETHVLDDADPGTHSMKYAWDPLGNLLRVVDGGGRTIHTAVFDSRSRPVRTIDTDLGQVDTTFDLMDRPLTITDGRGVTVTHTWDAAGRIATRSGPDGVTTYVYDTHVVPAQSAACHTAGRLAWVTDPSGAEVFCYDDHGNVIQTDKVVSDHGALPLVTASEYDALDRLGRVTHPSGLIVDYLHGDDGREREVTATNGALATSLGTFTYEASGKLAQVVLGNGVAVTYQHDRRQRPQRITAGAAPSPWVDLTFGYDDVGNVTSVVDAAAGESATYTYDDLYRLTSATGARFGGATETYRYDRYGNLTLKQSTDPASPAHVGALAYTDPLRLHAVTSAGGVTFTYDGAGNLTGDGTHTYTWNDRGLLAEVTATAGGAMVYRVTHDHLGRRVFKESGSGDTVVYVPAAGAELRTKAGSASWVARVRGGGIELARIEGTSLSFPIADHLGTPLVVLDAAGNLVERASTHPWGEENTASLGGAGMLADYLHPSDPLTTLERRFQGRERDDTGDYDYGARMYRPQLGRFLSADSIVPDHTNSQSWNRYAFVRNNPLRYIDPSGHTELDVVDDVDVDSDVDFGVTSADPSAGAELGFELKEKESGSTFACTTSGCTGSPPSAGDFSPISIERKGDVWKIGGSAGKVDGTFNVPAAPLGQDVNDLLGREAALSGFWAVVRGSEKGLNRARALLHTNGRAVDLYSRLVPGGAYRLTSPTLARQGVAGAVTNLGKPLAGVASKGFAVTSLYSFLLQGSPSYQRHLEEQKAAAADAAAETAIGSEEFMSAD